MNKGFQSIKVAQPYKSSMIHQFTYIIALVHRYISKRTKDAILGVSI